MIPLARFLGFWFVYARFHTKLYQHQVSLTWSLLGMLRRPTPAVPYWKVCSIGLGYLAEAATIGCCESILSELLLICLQSLRMIKKDGMSGLKRQEPIEG